MNKPFTRLDVLITQVTLMHLILSIRRAPGLDQVQLLDIVVPQHGGGQLGVEGRVLLGAPQHQVLSVN